MFNLVNHQPDIDKIYLHAQHPYEAKYRRLINKGKVLGLKHYNDSEDFIEYLNNVSDIYGNMEEYNPNNKLKILIVFEDMINDMLSNERM